MKALIVDDSIFDRKVLETLFRKQGYEVAEAENGQEGLDAALKEKPDLIISDVLMPLMDGFQFLKKLKEDNALKHIPVVFYSAVYTGDKELELALSMGAEAYIIKPKEPDLLWAELQEAIDKFKDKTAKTPASEMAVKSEHFLRQYVQIVAAKLEEKIRELDKVNNKLIATKNRLQHLLSYAPSVIYSCETAPPYTITFVSENVTLLTGYEVGEFMTDPNFRLRHIYPEDIPGMLEEMKNVLEKGYNLLEYRFLHKDGGYRWMRDEMRVALDEDGNPMEIVGYWIDITERRKLQEQLLQAQKMEAVGQLAGGISHDFNNILTAIIGYAHMLKMKMNVEDPLKKYAENILSLSDRAANLTQSLLAFSRKQIMKPSVINLNNIMMNVEKILSRLIGEDIDLEIVPAQRDLMVMVDYGQIEQTLMNLATNARDAMPDGGLLSIKTEALEIDEEFIASYGYGEKGEYAVITVTDTGTGMDEQTLAKIFEPFFTTKAEGKGTGLGLAMVYGIIKQHNGYINVASEPGKGTTFRIYLPVVSAKAETKATKFEEIFIAEKGSKTVLLAEDEKDVRIFIKGMLEEFGGYTVIEAADGNEAINKFRLHRDKIDVLLLDVIMPGKNGKEVYDEARKIQPKIKALFMSGYPADIISRAGIVEEGLHFISKPPATTVLLKELQQITGQ